jgi:hypothetical protein
LALTNPVQDLPQLLGIDVVIPPESITEPQSGLKLPLVSGTAGFLSPVLTATADSLLKRPLTSSGPLSGAVEHLNVTPTSVKEHILSSQSSGDTKRWEILGMPSGFGQQTYISAEQRARLLHRVEEVFELRTRFSAAGSFVFRMAEVVVSALAAVIHLNSGPEFHGEALLCGRRACTEAESMGSIIMFMRPDFTSAILFLCELFFWLKDDEWLRKMCALMKQLGERVPAIMPGCGTL